MSHWQLLLSLGLAALGTLTVMVVCLIARRFRTMQRESRLAAAKREFHVRREWLEAHFLTLASSTGRPRGLAWVDCDFSDDVCFARDRASGGLRALVAVTIQFRAVEGGGMEGVEAAGTRRAATAIFQCEKTRWETHGRAIFNLNPDETIRHFQHELEAVAD